LGGCESSAAGDKAGRGTVYLAKCAEDKRVDNNGMEVVFQCLRKRVRVVALSTGDVEFSARRW